MRDAGQSNISTVTLSFDEFRGSGNDEVPLATEVAKLYGTSHTTRVVTDREFDEDLPRILEAMDQPTIDGVNTWFVSKAAHELGLKVAVSGLGGDEFFGGYPSFKDVPRWAKWFGAPSRVPLLGETARRAFIAFARQSSVVSPKAAGMLEYGGSYPGAYLLRRGLFMPWELGEVMDQEMATIGLQRLSPLSLIGAAIKPKPRSAFATVATLESSLYMRNQLLRDTDWSSMAHSLEVRVPLVDAVLLSQAAPFVLADSGKVAKERLAAAPSKPLPSTVTRRKKTGFMTPVETWLQRSQPARHYATDSDAHRGRLPLVAPMGLWRGGSFIRVRHHDHSTPVRGRPCLM